MLPWLLLSAVHAGQFTDRCALFSIPPEACVNGAQFPDSRYAQLLTPGAPAGNAASCNTAGGQGGPRRCANECAFCDSESCYQRCMARQSTTNELVGFLREVVERQRARRGVAQPPVTEIPDQPESAATVTVYEQKTITLSSDVPVGVPGSSTTAQPAQPTATPRLAASPASHKSSRKPHSVCGDKEEEKSVCTYLLSILKQAATHHRPAESHGGDRGSRDSREEPEFDEIFKSRKTSKRHCKKRRHRNSRSSCEEEAVSSSEQEEKPRPKRAHRSARHAPPKTSEQASPEEHAEPSAPTEEPAASEEPVTVTRVLEKIKTVERPLTLFREFTTTVTRERPVVNYKITTFTAEGERVTVTRFRPLPAEQTPTTSSAAASPHIPSAQRPASGPEKKEDGSGADTPKDALIVEYPKEREKELLACEALRQGIEDDEERIRICSGKRQENNGRVRRVIDLKKPKKIKKRKEQSGTHEEGSASRESPKERVVTVTATAKRAESPEERVKTVTVAPEKVNRPEQSSEEVEVKTVTVAPRTRVVTVTPRIKTVTVAPKEPQRSRQQATRTVTVTRAPGAPPRASHKKPRAASPFSPAPRPASMLCKDGARRRFVLRQRNGRVECEPKKVCASPGVSKLVKRMSQGGAGNANAPSGGGSGSSENVVRRTVYI